MIFAARPDVLNHNLETVARLHRAARPSAAYFRSLALLARAKDAGLLTKSGIILGMGETADELRGAIADLRNVGVDILTLGQYLRPSASTFRSPAGGPRRSSPSSAPTPRASASPTSSPGRSSAPATTRNGRPTAEPSRWADVLRASGWRGRGEHMRELGVDVLLLSTGADLPYLTGLRGDAARAADHAGGCRSTATRCSWCRGSKRRVSSSSPTRSRSRPWDETDDPIAVVAGLVGASPDAASAAIGDHTWARFVLDLQRALPDVAFRRAVDVTGPLRVVKDAAEIDALRAPAPRRRRHRRGDARPGRSPAGPSSTCTASWSSACSTPGTSAPTSRSSPSGPNAASPHHDPCDRVIGDGDVVLCDFGGTMHGYCSDITRMFVVGEPGSEVRDAYDGARRSAGGRACARRPSVRRAKTSTPPRAG